MDCLAAIRRDSDLFYATADGADPTRRVPSCPDWSIADLVWHLGEVHWFWATVVETRATSPDEVEKAKPPRPDGSYAELVAWGRSQADRLLQVLDANADDVRVWTWALQDDLQNVGFIRRHQVQEAAVHLWDMQMAATGVPDPLDAEGASDAIDEFLGVTLPWCVTDEKPLPGSVHIHCTDVAGEWFIHPNGTVETVHAKGDAAIRGTASDIVLALFKRIPITAVEVLGDASVAAALITAVDTE